ncbi:MAG: TolC family protein [Nitrospina sp.]|jgi:hypothetical protein|nr:TolC family protein [Nitrospina sp.]MBT5633220.1 TolC family protein [Nitrospina sp.]
MCKKLKRNLIKPLPKYIAVVFLICAVLISNSMAGGLEPLTGLQRAVDKAGSLYDGNDVLVLADKEYQVQKYYYQVQSKTQKLEILNEVKGHFEKAVTKAEEKFDSGEEDVSQSAITKLKLGLAGTLNSIIELESEIKIAKLSLALILKDSSFPDREMLDSNIEPVQFKFDNYDTWFKESGLAPVLDPNGINFSSKELALRTGYLKAIETREKLNLSKSNRKITRALLVSEVANYDFGIGDAGDLFEALIIYTRVLSGYYDSVYHFNLAVADLNRVKASWTEKP